MAIFSPLYYLLTDNISTSDTINQLSTTYKYIGQSVSECVYLQFNNEVSAFRPENRLLFDELSTGQ